LETGGGGTREYSRLLVPPSGGFLEIGNKIITLSVGDETVLEVPPSGGFLEIGNKIGALRTAKLLLRKFPLRGDS